MRKRWFKLILPRNGSEGTSENRQNENKSQKMGIKGSNEFKLQSCSGTGKDRQEAQTSWWQEKMNRFLTNIQKEVQKESPALLHCTGHGWAESTALGLSTGAHPPETPELMQEPGHLLGPWDITGRVRRRLGPMGPRQTLPSPSPDAALGFLLLSDLTLRQAGNATLFKGSLVQRKEISKACGAVFFEEMFSRYL